MITSPQIRTTDAIVFDLEYTAWQGSMARRWMAPGEYREVVQIGAVKVDAASFSIRDEFQILVRPRINAELSDYFVQLTGIGNDVVMRDGIDFPQAYRAYVEFADGAPMFAFGRDDLVLKDNLRLYGIADAPALPCHINCVPWLLAQGIETRGAHACDVAKLCSVPFEGRAHDALDDARSVARGIAGLIARGAPSPLLELAT